MIVSAHTHIAIILANHIEDQGANRGLLHGRLASSTVSSCRAFSCRGVTDVLRDGGSLSEATSVSERDAGVLQELDCCWDDMLVLSVPIGVIGVDAREAFAELPEGLLGCCSSD